MGSDARRARSVTGEAKGKYAEHPGQIIDAKTRIGGDSEGNEDKTGQKADSVQSIENRQCYETEEEKRKFIGEGFQLDMNAILDADAKLKEAVIKLFQTISKFQPRILVNMVKTKYQK